MLRKSTQARLEPFQLVALGQHLQAMYLFAAMLEPVFPAISLSISTSDPPPAMLCRRVRLMPTSWRALVGLELLELAASVKG
jgi:hypothetical protein